MGYDRNDCYMTCGERDDRCAELGISDPFATIERLRTALKPFAEVGLPMLRVGKAAVPDGASAHYLKLEPLTAADFRAAALAFKDEQQVPDDLTPHPYMPSGMHMGDCAVCGHLQGAPIHSEDKRS